MTGAAVKEVSGEDYQVVRYTQELNITSKGLQEADFAHDPAYADTEKGEKDFYLKWLDLDNGKRGQVKVEETTKSSGIELASLSGVKAGDRIRLFYDVKVKNDEATTVYEITINAKNFPGTYRIYGDTVVRNRNGLDTPFQFVVNRAKVGSEVTFTMEAEGDPSVFDMSLRVLRDDDGNMIKFVKYNLGDAI